MTQEKRVALVLGAIKGIGKAIGLDLARRGIRTSLNYFDWEESLPQMQADFKAVGTPHAVFRNDLTDCEAALKLVEDTVRQFGRLDILINNIERGGWPIVHGPYQPAQWDLEFNTTLRAKQWIFEAALPYLRASGGSSVINFSSIAGVVGRSGPASLVFNDGYAAAQRGIRTLTEIWARTAAPEVRVNEIMLGLMETRHGPETRGWGLLAPDQRQALIAHTLVGRIGRLEDVTRAVWFLLNDAPYMTGGVLRLDGGYVLGGEPVAPMPPGVL
ncbi:MAG: SDR family oxidoreductase [Desulfobacterales bacterium]|nr:SDR family oxidoreductase [Desulfobacterales bacterium]MDJ0856156.1 SDR family oxidoreductase [Desulfobacterales bacterium]